MKSCCEECFIKLLVYVFFTSIKSVPSWEYFSSEIKATDSQGAYGEKKHVNLHYSVYVKKDLNSDKFFSYIFVIFCCYRIVIAEFEADLSL